MKKITVLLLAFFLLPALTPSFQASAENNQSKQFSTAEGNEVYQLTQNCLNETGYSEGDTRYSTKYSSCLARVQEILNSIGNENNQCLSQCFTNKPGSTNCDVCVKAYSSGEYTERTYSACDSFCVDKSPGQCGQCFTARDKKNTEVSTAIDTAFADWKETHKEKATTTVADDTARLSIKSTAPKDTKPVRCPQNDQKCFNEQYRDNCHPATLVIKSPVENIEMTIVGANEKGCVVREKYLSSKVIKKLKGKSLTCTISKNSTQDLDYVLFEERSKKNCTGNAVKTLGLPKTPDKVVGQTTTYKEGKLSSDVLEKSIAFCRNLTSVKDCDKGNKGWSRDIQVHVRNPKTGALSEYQDLRRRGGCPMNGSITFTPESYSKTNHSISGKPYEVICAAQCAQWACEKID